MPVISHITLFMFTLTCDSVIVQIRVDDITNVLHITQQSMYDTCSITRL